MGMVYRRKTEDPVTGNMVEKGPWWMKFYDQGRPVYQSTGKVEKREALAMLKRAEARALEGQRDSHVVHRIRFDDLVQDLKQDYATRAGRHGKDGKSIWFI